jgi:hypothetical protein
VFLIVGKVVLSTVLSVLSSSSVNKVFVVSVNMFTAKS